MIVGICLIIFGLCMIAYDLHRVRKKDPKFQGGGILDILILLLQFLFLNKSGIAGLVGAICIGAGVILLLR